jgi:hypothetical protein
VPPLSTVKPSPPVARKLLTVTVRSRSTRT